MTIKLGRVGTDISLRNPSQWGLDGNKVTLAGFSDGAGSYADGVTLQQQMLGLADNPDEPFIACTWTEEAWFDGYYRVESVSAPALPGAFKQGWFPYTIVLERVADGASPTIDVSLLGALRTNGNSVTTGRANTWIPGDSVGAYAASFAGASAPFNNAGTGQSRTSETGAVVSFEVTGTAAVTNGFSKFDVGPADYYDGQCLIRSGATLRRTLGARMKTLPVNWELSNGLIRITPAATSTIQIEIFNGAAWEDARTFMFTLGSASTSNHYTAAWADLSVLRNSPECVTIRIISGPAASAAATNAEQIDISLQRGRYFADIFAYNNTANSQWGIARTTAEAATAITGGIRATSNDASGNRFVLAMSQAKTNDLTQGAVRSASAAGKGVNMMLGYELDGSSSAAPNTAQNIVDEWYYAVEERMAPRTR